MTLYEYKILSENDQWDAVHQKLGRIKPTFQKQGTCQINDGKGLENDANAFGGKDLFPKRITNKL
jgi:hypothetical protein